MYLFQRILRAIRRWFRRKPANNFNLDVDTLYSIQVMAALEQRTPEDVASQLLSEALHNRQTQELNYHRWLMLTPREQEIAALICLNYTTRQITAKLQISPETVKTHVEHVLAKLETADRQTLRALLSGWDFSAWDQ